jgi:hypothetical protein
VELSIPSDLAFQSEPRTGPLRWFAGLYSRRTGAKTDR